MSISATQVKELRQRTSAGMMDCKRALKETDGNFEKAIEYLRKKGLSSADKKAGRATLEGGMSHYIHSNGKIGVLVEVTCETDFVAKTDKFRTFTSDISMHIAASDPVCVAEKNMPPEFIEKERSFFLAQVKEDPRMAGKPEDMLHKIVDGKVKKIYSEQVLLNQPFVKNTDITVESYLKETIASLGENITIRRFVRFVLGEES